MIEGGETQIKRGGGAAAAACPTCWWNFCLSVCKHNQPEQEGILAFSPWIEEGSVQESQQGWGAFIHAATFRAPDVVAASIL